MTHLRTKKFKAENSELRELTRNLFKAPRVLNKATNIHLPLSLKTVTTRSTIEEIETVTSFEVVLSYAFPFMLASE